MASKKSWWSVLPPGALRLCKSSLLNCPPISLLPIFVTQHLYERGETILPRILTAAGRLPAKHPSLNERMLPGRIYVAPPGYHLLLSPGLVTLGHGPKENLQRPFINVMFRSAAASYGKDVIGVLLTGMLDDGAAG